MGEIIFDELIAMAERLCCLGPDPEGDWNEYVEKYMQQHKEMSERQRWWNKQLCEVTLSQAKHRRAVEFAAAADVIVRAGTKCHTVFVSSQVSCGTYLLSKKTEATSQFCGSCGR